MVLLLPAMWGATYYVSPTGNDAAAGTEAQPWLTIYRATRKFPWYIQPGDTLMVRGGVYSGNANAIDIGSGLGYSGTSDKPITIKAYPGETPIVTGMTSPYAAVLLKSKSYWILDGITYSNCYSFLFFQDVTHFVITNCVFTTMPAADSRYTGISLMGASQYNIFTHNTVAKWGAVQGTGGTSGTYVLYGSPMVLGNEADDSQTYYNLIESCRFYHGGHDLIECASAYNVFRNNDFHNEPWIPTNSTYYMLPNFGNTRFETNTYGAYSARIVKPGDAGTVQIDLRNVWEGNRMHYTGPPCDSGGSFGIEMGTRQGIWRNNTIAFTLAAGVYFNTSGMTSRSTSNCFYNNVIFNCGLAKLFGGSQMQSFCYGLTMSTLEGRRTNNFVVNNIIWNNLPADVDPNIYLYQAIRTNWIGGLGLPDPLFVSTNGYGDYFGVAGVPNFRLRPGSPVIDKGTWLAYVTSAAGTGTSFTVDNSLYFSDGNRIVPGDTIQLEGQTARAVVSSNDFVNNTLYFSPALTWRQGQGVALPYNGAAPDMGAFETSAPGQVQGFHRAE